MSDEPNKLAEEAVDQIEVDSGAENHRPVTDEMAVPAQDDAAGSESGDSLEATAELPAVEQANDAPEGEQDQDVADEKPSAELASEGDVVDATVEEESIDDDSVEEEPIEEESGAGPIFVEPEVEEDIQMDWYILKVQSNRERSIAEALERKMKIEGLEQHFDQVIVPTEKVTEFKGGKKKVVERKLYPGYIVVHMHINDDTWFAVRETSGVGDFTGAGGKPTPMLPHEVSRIVQTETEETEEAPKLDIKFSMGDKVKVKEGNFESFEGEVGSIDEASGRVTVMINIFGRSTPVELEYWQIEAM